MLTMNDKKPKVSIGEWTAAQLIELLHHNIRDSDSILTSGAVCVKFACVTAWITSGLFSFLPHPQNGQVYRLIGLC